MADLNDGSTNIDESLEVAEEVPNHCQSTSRCYLLELPAELRNEICKLALHQTRGVKVDLKTGCLNRKDLALTMTNKQLRDECIALYFGVSTFIFNLTYISFPGTDTSYEWFDEQATFNYFVRRHRASLKVVRIHFEGLSDIQNIVWCHGKYFMENLQALRTGFGILQRNKVSARILMCLRDMRGDLNITLGEQSTTEAEIETQFRASDPDGDLHSLCGGNDNWMEESKEILIEVLYGKYSRRIWGDF